MHRLMQHHWMLYKFCIVWFFLHWWSQECVGIWCFNHQFFSWKMRHERQFVREMRAHRQGAFLKGVCRLLGDFWVKHKQRMQHSRQKKVCFSLIMPKGLNVVVFFATWWFWENMLSQKRNQLPLECAWESFIYCHPWWFRIWLLSTASISLHKLYIFFSNTMGWMWYNSLQQQYHWLHTPAIYHEVSCSIQDFMSHASRGDEQSTQMYGSVSKVLGRKIIFGHLNVQFFSTPGPGQQFKS